ncbi:MAG: hypothetical protein AAGF88_01930 [Pseudomonadota bacterium]
MTELTRDDIRAAVGAGMIDEAQAASILALSEERHGARRHLAGLDEPFELFRGFNEIFIVVGLTILYSGWWGMTGVAAFAISQDMPASAMIFGLIGAVASVALARYFTIRRRMVAPSIALTAFYAISIGQIGLGFALWQSFDEPGTLTLISASATVALLGYYLWFRVPIAMAVIAIGVFATCFGLITAGGTVPEDPRDFFLLTNDGPFAILTFALGMIGFVAAMWFDMGDPHRVALRSRAGFWLHVVSAPAIVNTVALTLFSLGTVSALSMLFVFVAALAIVAVVIDRRSFLISGVGYIVALALTVLNGEGFVAILLLGFGLILLGAKWEALRGLIMGSLPQFPGKDRLPPWAA